MLAVVKGEEGGVELARTLLSHANVNVNEYMTFYILNKSCQKYRKIII